LVGDWELSELQMVLSSVRQRGQEWVALKEKPKD